MTKHYRAKLLLFGEYTVLDHKHAFTVPIKQFSGYWKQGSTDDAIESLIPKLSSKARDLLDIERMESDFNDGFYFHSNIPIGYGLGSSGALTAALYDKYALDKKSNLKELRSELASIENTFHGNSSGIDPLTSYTNTSLLFRHDQIESYTDGLSAQKDSPWVFFIINSHLERSTKKLVEIFQRKREDSKFNFIVKDTWPNLVEKCINAHLTNDNASLRKGMEDLSLLQFDHMSEMIPSKMHSLWTSGLQEKSHYMKLCGAGGGGYFLGYGKREKVVSLGFEIL